jgi:acyl carrier protein
MITDSIEEFLTKIKEQLEDVDTTALGTDNDFKELEWWSSMNALIIIAFINTEYGTKFTAAELKTCSTIRQLYDFVAKSNA